MFIVTRTTRRPLQDPAFLAKFDSRGFSLTEHPDAHASSGSSAPIGDLAAENGRLRKQLAKRTRAAGGRVYLAAVRKYMQRGYSRHQAVAMASREHPQGRQAFLLDSNRDHMAATIRLASKTAAASKAR